MVLAAVALIVSLYSLYLGALRRPTIQVDHVDHERELTASVWSGAMPERADLELKVVVANTGASGTYVERLQLSGDYTPRGSNSRGSSPLGDFAPTASFHPPGHSGRPPVVPPVGFERGEVEPYELTGVFSLTDQSDPTEFARKLHGLEAIELEVVWWYRRPDFLRPSRRRTVRQTRKIQVDAGPLKSRIAAHWAGHEDYAEQARILAPG